MIHLTLNSGKYHRQSKRVLLPELTDRVRPFLDQGGGTFPRPFEAYRIETEVTETGVAFEYYKGETPISVCVGTWSAEAAGEYWSDIQTTYFDVTDVCPRVSWAKRLPREPKSLPWLATLLLPGFFIQVNSDGPDVGFLHTSEVVFFWVARDLVVS